MNKTKHVGARMGQRGISQEMLDMVLALGKDGNAGRFFISRKQAQQMLGTLKKILDKGGVEVVMEGNTMITAYNFRSQRH